MLIFFGVALMIVFLLPQLFDSADVGGGSGVDNPKVVEVEGKSIFAFDLERMRDNHLIAHNVLSELQNRARQRVSTDQQLPSIYDRIQTGNLSQQNLNRIFLRRKLVANEGRQLGIKITEESVVDYVAHVTGQLFNTEQKIDAEIRALSNGRFDFAKLRPHIIEDLYFTRTADLFQVGLPRLPSLSRGWELYNKLNRRMECDVLELSIEDEIAKISETPSNAELQKIYDEGRYELRDPENKKPGFKVGPRIAVGYFEAKFSRFVKAAESEVSPEAVEAEYERLVKENDPLVIENVSRSEEKIDLNLGDEQDDDDPAPKPPTEDEAEADRKSGEEDDQGKNDDDSSTDRNDDNEKDGNVDDSADRLGEESLSSFRAGGIVNLAAVQTIIAQHSSVSMLHVSGHQTVEIAQDESQSEEQAEKRETSQDESADREDDQENDSDEAAKQAESQTDNVDKQQEGDQSGANVLADIMRDLGANQQPDDVIRVRTLQEVAGQIKTKLAAKIASEKLARVLTEVESILMDFRYDELRDWQEANPNAVITEGPKFNAQAIADRFGLTYHATELMQFDEFLEHEIGRVPVMVEMVDPNFGFSRPQSGLLAGFYLMDFHQLDYYVGRTFQSLQIEEAGFEPDQYVVWTIDKAEVKVRSFQDARDDVIAFWKQQKAKERVLERAQAIAKEAAEAKSLRDRYSDEVVSTGGFTWLNQFTQGFSPVNGVAKPSEEFMATAFALGVNETGIAANADHTAVYVIMKTADDPRNETEMRESFFRTYAQMNARLKMDFPSSIPLLPEHQRDLQDVLIDLDDYLTQKYTVRWLNQ